MARMCFHMLSNLALLGALVCGGCATHTVRFAPDTGKPPIDSIAVLDFQERAGPSDAHMTQGVVVPAASGRVVADLLRRALEDLGVHRVMSRDESLKRLAAAGLTLEGARLDERAAVLGKALGVDGVVVGRVEEYGLKYRLVSQRARIHLIFWCVRSSDASRCWEAEIEDEQLFGHERELAERRIRECVADLAK